MKSKDIFAKSMLFALVALFGVGIFFNFKYIITLEEQVSQRDSLIRELSFSDQLVREYFEVQVDTLNHSRSYSLKSNKKTRVIERHEHTVEIDGEKLTFEQFFNEYLSQIDKYNLLVNDYNALVKELKKSNSALINSKRSIYSVSRKADSLQALLQEKQYYLNCISREYGIICKTEIEGNLTRYSMKGSPQLDSALRIYPYFKDLAVYNKDKDLWMISIPNKKRIETIVEIAYKQVSK